VRVHGNTAEPALIGEKDRRADFAMVVDPVASKPHPSKTEGVRYAPVGAMLSKRAMCAFLLLD